MHVAIDLPDDIAQQLQTGGPDMPRHVLESVALEAYRARLLGESQIRRLLGFETRYEVHGFLKEHGILLHYTLEDLERDRQTHDRLGVSCWLLPIPPPSTI
jgi:hypothetical protein